MNTHDRLKEIIQMNTSPLWRAETITDEFIVVPRDDDATVERVAQAIAEKLGHGWAFENDHSSRYATRQRFMDAARAVLAALTEPGAGE